MSEQETPLPDPAVEPAEEPQEPPQPEPTPEPSPEPEPPQQPEEQPEEQPDSQALMEEIGKKLDALQKTVATRISTILGEHANDFEVCDLCSYWNTPGWRMKGHLPEELRISLAHVIGQRLPGHLQEDKHSRACPDCGGEGAVKTGSNVPGQDTLPCVECEGMGWMPTDDARRRGRLPLANGATAQALGVAPQDLAMSPTPQEEPPEAVALRQMGYVVVPPIPAGA